MLEVDDCDLDNYIIIDDDDDESRDSDQIDSDVEAELYSTIHHEVTSKESQNGHVEQNSMNIVSETQANVEIENPFKCDLVSRSDLYKDSNNPVKKMHCENNIPLKRKSNVIANILDNIQTNTKISNKKQKTMKNANSPKVKTRSPMKVMNVSTNMTVVKNESDNSDSDNSVIFVEPNELGKLDTNIAETLDLVSSDSDSSSSMNSDKLIFTPSLTKRHMFCSTPVSKGDPWYINTTDVFRRRRSSGRYHETAALNCTNCNKRGHTTKYCTESKIVKCFICGGTHPGSRCQNKICSRCLRFGHDKWRCLQREEMCCHLCNMLGHNIKACPDLWRRYHLTTFQKKIVKGKPEATNTAIYCFNCGLQGHFGFHCAGSRQDDSLPTWTSVISYGDPKIPISDTMMNAPLISSIAPLISSYPLPTWSEMQRFSAGKSPINKRKEKRMKSILKLKRKFENRLKSANNSQEIDFPRMSDSSQLKPRLSKSELKKKRAAKARRKRRALLREAAKLIVCKSVKTEL